MASHGARGKGITQADIVAAASAEAGEAMDAFFARHVDATAELPLPELLARIGVRGDLEVVGDQAARVVGGVGDAGVRARCGRGRCAGGEDFFEVALVQLVKVMKAGEEVRMSKRSGEFVTLRDLMDLSLIHI